MNPTDPLAQLKDIHLPEAIQPWPIAIGWWALAFVSIALIILLSYTLKAYRVKQAWRKAAKQQLQTLAAETNFTSFENQALTLIRQLLVQHGGARVKHLSGEALKQFFNQQLSTTIQTPALDFYCHERFQAQQGLNEDKKRQHYLHIIEQLIQSKPCKPSTSTSTEQMQQENIQAGEVGEKAS